MNNKNKNILLGVLIVGVLSMTIAFAALSTRLRISGTANIPEAKWDIHFENWAQARPRMSLANVENRASQTTAATITESEEKGTLISGLVVSLAQPGDIMEYTFDIVNDGTMVGLLNNFNKTISATVTGSQTAANTNDLTYSVVCGSEATKGSQALGDSPTEPLATDTIGAGNARACKLTISYNVQTNNNVAGQDQTYTGQARTVTLTANWTWVQGNATVNNNQNEPTPDPVVTWNNYITPNQTSGASLPSGSLYWIQENTTSGDKEICGISNGQTICLELDRWDYDENDSECEQSTYICNKKRELEQKTNAECTGLNDGTLQCTASDGLMYTYEDFGNVSISDDSGTCAFDGTASCYKW